MRISTIRHVEDLVEHLKELEMKVRLRDHHPQRDFSEFVDKFCKKYEQPGVDRNAQQQNTDSK